MSSSGSRGRGARTVLCTNGLLSKTLAVVRSLGARNIRVIVSEKIRFHTSGFSKYSAKTLTYPDPVVNGGAFLEWLVGTITREGIDVVFPMDDDTMEIAIHHRAELERLCGLPIPPTGSYMVAADKSNTMKLAMSAGVPCPRTLELSVHGQPTGEQFALIESSLEYPLAIKPRQSAGGRGVRFVHNRDELISTYQAIHAEYPNPIVQEYIPPGPKYDVCLCYDRDNKLRASFAQKRIRNFPIDRGSSTVHESVDAPELLAHALKFMAHLPWYGIADFEFMVDPRDGRPKLLEINPRFWTSLHLAIRCGVDFPWILYKLALGEELPAAGAYAIGKQGRSVIPGDILHFITNPRRWHMNPPLWATRIPDDMISLDDPMATVGFVMSALRYSVDARMWRFLITR